jgi:hypothetical protein
MPKVAVPVALSYAYAAYDASSRVAHAGGWTGFAVAGALVVGIVPFTLVGMSGVIGKLERALEGSGAEAKSHDETATLIKHWSSLNVLRSLLPLAGSVLGAVTLFNNLS